MGAPVSGRKVFNLRFEEFLILESDLIDDDRSRFGPGDFVSYEPAPLTTRGPRAAA
jgi:hypothetical protein